ncbi:MAG: hypothetical protein JW822_12145 [Spirochaetales bacterium]|nr:hypothetical protein [Spirochaetales bacterium]
MNIMNATEEGSVNEESIAYLWRFEEDIMYVIDKPLDAAVFEIPEGYKHYEED